MGEALLVFGHRGANVVWNLGFDGKLEVSALLEPKQLLVVEASVENGLANIASVAHQVAEKCDDVQERGFSASVRADERSESADILFDGFQAAESACLNACEHVSLVGSQIIFAKASLRLAGLGSGKAEQRAEEANEERGFSAISPD
jgi:hypothetical protein